MGGGNIANEGVLVDCVKSCTWLLRDAEHGVRAFQQIRAAGGIAAVEACLQSAHVETFEAYAVSALAMLGEAAPHLSPRATNGAGTRDERGAAVVAGASGAGGAGGGGDQSLPTAAALADADVGVLEDDAPSEGGSRGGSRGGNGGALGDDASHEVPSLAATPSHAELMGQHCDVAEACRAVLVAMSRFPGLHDAQLRAAEVIEAMCRQPSDFETPAEPAAAPEEGMGEIADAAEETKNGS